MSEKIFSSAMSEQTDGMKAIEELAAKVNADLGGKSCDLAILFLSEGFVETDPADLMRAFDRLVSPGSMLGCNSNGVVGDGREIEMAPAISVMAMHLPGVQVQTFSGSPEALQGVFEPEDFIRRLGVNPKDDPKFICLADPMSCDVGALLDLYNTTFGGAPVIGGMASGQAVGVPSWLCLDGVIYRRGFVGAALIGDVEFDVVVSQGCRPIGETHIITKAEGNILYQIRSRPAMEVLKETISQASLSERLLAQRSLFVGLVIDESRQSFGRGDFLIRNIVGADHDNGALVIGEHLRVGQTLQFQVRDAGTSEEDLCELLEGKAASGGGGKPAGALLVSCCGRGVGMFREPDHDAALIQEMCGPVPMTGFFANGEFGPVDRKNHIHGYTSSFTIIR